MNIAHWCQAMAEVNASDLFLCVGRVPSVRRAGRVEQITESPVLTEEDLRAFVNEYLPAGTWERLQREQDVDVGANIGGAGRFRINLSWQMGQGAAAIRQLPTGDLDFARLNIPDAVRILAESPRGLILITGATGCGKTTTMAAMLNHINRTASKHIITLEDPIEFVHTDLMSVISQREIGGDTKNFSSALRHVVRQNPDVIFIGELRDRETIETAVSAAMTGHLVCATFHTIDAERTIERILNFFPEGLREQIAQDFAMSLQGIVSQRLLPTADGKQRVPAFEILLATPLVRRLIAQRELSRIPYVIKENPSLGMIDFNRSLLQLCKNGVIDIETAAAAASNRDEFMLMAAGMETGADTFRRSIEEETTESGFNLKRLLRDSLAHGASDLLLTADSPPVVRIDGTLRPYEMPLLTSADTRQLLFSVLSDNQRVHFESHREIDFALAVSGINGAQGNEEEEFRFRVNGFYQKGRIAVSLRLIPSAIPSPEKLGIPGAVLSLTRKQQGFVLITGPTGSGKSTTLAALINLININRACHIITIEDPIEFVHKHQRALIEQREVGEDTKSFANALKYVLREDPDVILIGEMRDPETIAAALTAAETGHLVFATLHTNDVTQSVDRIIDVFPPSQQGQVRAQLSASLECIVAQRLMPLNSPEGGRCAAFEVLMGTPAVRALVRDKKTHLLQSAMETSAKDGMITMEKALRNLFDAGKITRETYRAMSRVPLSGEL